MGLLKEEKPEEKKKPEKMVRVAAIEPTHIDGKHLDKDQEMEVTESQFAALSARLRKVEPLILFLIGMVALWLATPRSGAQNAPSQATQYSPAVLTQTNGIPLDGVNTNAVILATAATNYNQIIPLTKYGDVGLQMTFKLQAAGSQVVNAFLDQSFDGLNWVNGVAAFGGTANGTTAVTVMTNITVNTVGYLRLNYITNASGVNLTNLLFRVVYKPSRFGL